MFELLEAYPSAPPFDWLFLGVVVLFFVVLFWSELTHFFFKEAKA